MNPAEELLYCRRLLGWVYERSRHGCSSHKRSEKDQALADLNSWTAPYGRYYTQGKLIPISKDKQWMGESP